MSKNEITKQQSDFLLYTSTDGQIKVDVVLQDENIWLTQKAMVELFGKERSVITKHIKNIFASGELEEKSNVQKMHFAHSDKPIKFYNLDAFISVGYRVNSHQATQFSIWETKTLKEYIIKDSVLNDERFKQSYQVFGSGYYDRISINNNQIHTLEKIRDTLLPKLMSREVRVKI